MTNKRKKRKIPLVDLDENLRPLDRRLREQQKSTRSKYSGKPLYTSKNESSNNKELRSYYSRKGKLEISNKKDFISSKKEVFKNGTVLDHFKMLWLSNPDGAEIDISNLDAEALFRDKEFIDFVIENEVIFSSSNNNNLVDIVSEMLVHIYEKLRLIEDQHHDVSKVMKKTANDFAETMKDTIEELDELGFLSLKQKADELNSREIKTSRGSEWTKAAVSRILKRIEKDDRNEQPQSPKP